MNEKDEFSQFENMYWQVSRRMNYMWKDLFERKFPGSQSYILFLLEKNGPKKMTELAESLRLTPGAVTSLSDKLINQGFLARVRDEKDRRVVYLEITEQGKEALNTLRDEGKKTMRSFFDDISPTDIQHLVRIFEQVAQNIDRVGEE